MVCVPAVYEWYQRGLALLQTGDVHAAATLLERAVAVEPEKGSIREALARAYFRSRRFSAALGEFTVALEISPVNDYAHFGAGLCLGRLGRLHEAVGHLRMANVMRPGNDDYEGALALYERQLGASAPDDQGPKAGDMTR
jgi:tetratricopeptide (TPR) repeat protein